MIRPVRKIEDNRILTPNQADFLLEFSESELKDVFRLTGGTALSAFFLEHRLSEDLDFFSTEKISIHLCRQFLSGLKSAAIISATRKFDRNIFLLKHEDNSTLKVEFTYYPLQNIEATWDLGGLRVDGFLDIVVNKLCAIADRIESKDYLDVYWALKKGDHSLEELMVFAERKCEIRGINHILKNRLLQLPEGIDLLPLLVDIKPYEVRSFFERAVREIVRKEISVRE
ncbi:MAG: nucleotidyl transferase AbiEii/AbiGii toxin family protein [Desulfobacterales bacterium]|nr:nucleotidyl transferase AbiEii/AbiGii toxin family protein [Desulfobacterales bacterium]